MIHDESRFSYYAAQSLVDKIVVEWEADKGVRHPY